MTNKHVTEEICNERRNNYNRMINDTDANINQLMTDNKKKISMSVFFWILGTFLMIYASIIGFQSKTISEINSEVESLKKENNKTVTELKKDIAVIQANTQWIINKLEKISKISINK